MERRTGKIRGAFSRMHRALDGWILARTPFFQLKASTTMDLGILFFLIFVRCVALRNLELLIKTVGTYWSDLLLRTLVVGRRQQSESIEAALDMK